MSFIKKLPNVTLLSEHKKPAKHQHRNLTGMVYPDGFGGCILWDASIWSSRRVICQAFLLIAYLYSFLYTYSKLSSVLNASDFLRQVGFFWGRSVRFKFFHRFLELCREKDCREDNSDDVRDRL